MEAKIEICAAVVKDNKILLRRDVSGNWRLLRRDVEEQDFDKEIYYSAIFRAIQRELPEESGLILDSLALPISMLPAWLCNNNLIDLAFVVLLPWQRVIETKEFKDKFLKGELGFFSKDEIGKLDIVSPRMKYMIEQAFSVLKLSP